MRVYGYDEFAVDTKELSGRLSDFGADGIVFIARGGATLAHFIAMNTGVRKMYALNTASYEGQTKLGAPTDFEVTVRNLKISAGAGFIVALTGEIMTMPGLPKVPAATKIDVDESGKITGLF